MALNIKTLGDCVELVKRRKYLIIIPWLVFSVIAVIVAYNLPKTYRSTATMLFVSPLSTKLFESTISQFADEQFQSIYQRVMTTENVLSIIESNGLYADARKGNTEHELADIFRGSVDVDLATSSITTKPSADIAQVAFDISFNYSDPIKAKETAGTLAALFVEQNDKARSQGAIKATDFLMEESEKLNLDLQEIENKIATYKEQNNFSLPEQAQGNFAAIDRAENELRDTENQIRSTKERIAYLAAELARAQNELPSTLDDKVPQNKDDALRVLRAQYLKLSSIYSPSHPSLIRLKREIKALEPSFEGQVSGDDILKQLTEAKKELKYLEETYSSNHPNIIKQKNQIKKLELLLRNGSQDSKEQTNASSAHTTNPAYLGVDLQYKTSQSELQTLQRKQDYLKEKLDKMQNLLTVAPQIEKGYNDLIRERDESLKKYTQIKEKLHEARLLQTQEQQQQGQTLTIIDKPVVPTHPEKAIRRKLAIGGFFLGLVAGLGLAFLAELLDPRLRGYRAVAESTGLMPIIVIPYIETPSELETKLAIQRKEKKMLAFAIVVGILLAIAVIFSFFLPIMQN
jgi:polysaccharide biosynthesis transport protein